MRKANHWKPLGTVTKQIAAKLIALREVQENGLTAGQADKARVNGLALRREDVCEDRRADAGRLRRANGASKEIREAALLPPGEAGQGKAAPRHGLPPLFNTGD